MSRVRCMARVSSAGSILPKCRAGRTNSVHCMQKSCSFSRQCSRGTYGLIAYMVLSFLFFSYLRLLIHSLSSFMFLPESLPPWEWRNRPLLSSHGAFPDGIISHRLRAVAVEEVHTRALTAEYGIVTKPKPLRKLYSTA